MKNNAEVVIIGGGIIGCNLLFYSGWIGFLDGVVYFCTY